MPMKRAKVVDTPPPWYTQEKWSAAVIFFITVLVYLPSLGNDFIDYYDDSQYVLLNEHVNRGLTWSGLAWLPTGVVVANWHPLTNLTHMLDVQLFGLHPWGHHLTSVALHALASALLFVLMRRLTSAHWPSMLVAALFALHPLHVESVSWVAERKDVLSGCLWFSTTLAYLRYVREPSVRRYAPVLILFLMALASKVMVVTLPFTLLLLDLWPLGRMGQVAENKQRVRRFATLVTEKIPLFLLSIAGAALVAVLQRADATLKPLEMFPMSLRIVNAVTSYVKYLAMMAWPFDLSFYYPLVQPPAWQWTLSLFALVAITGVVLWQARRRPYLPVGWFWYVGTLVPVIQLVQTGSHAMADRYTYIPSIGVFVMVAWLLREAANRSSRMRQATVFATSTALVLFSTLTYFQQAYWSNSEVLFKRALEVTRENPVANYLLGAVYMGQGRLVEAERHIREGLRIFPDGRLGYFTLGSVKYIGGDFPAAIDNFRKAAENGVEDGTAHFWTGRALDRMGRRLEADEAYQLALKEFEKVRERNAANAGTAVNTAIVLERLGRNDEALARYEEALRLNPDLGAAREGIARLKATADAPVPSAGTRAPHGL